MSKEAMKLALEALTATMATHGFRGHIEEAQDKAIKALEEALAKQEQGEPAAWMDIDEKGAMSGLRYWSEPDNRHEVALYTTPQQRDSSATPRTWVGLTDAEYDEIWRMDLNNKDIMDKTISKLKEKNT